MSEYDDSLYEEEMLEVLVRLELGLVMMECEYRPWYTDCPIRDREFLRVSLMYGVAVREDCLARLVYTSYMGLLVTPLLLELLRDSLPAQEWGRGK